MAKNKLLKDYYKQFKAEGKVNMPYSEFKELFALGVDYMTKELLTGNKVRLPAGLGQISIVGHRQKKLPVDWNSTLKLWEQDAEAKTRKQLVYFLNLNTEGLIFKLKWWLSSTKLKNVGQYALKAVWGLRVEIKKSLSDGGQNYEILHGFQKWKKAPSRGEGS